MWGERGLISHKFEGTGDGVLACALKGSPGAAREFTMQLGGCTVGVSWACSWRLPDGPGWQLGVHYGRAAGGCPMGQAGSWAGALWSCSWRLPDGPGWQLGGCTMAVQLAVARWARLAAGRVHYGRAAGGCPMGQAGSWAGAQWAFSWRLPDGPGCQLGGCTMGVQLAVARWARLSAGRVLNGRAAGGCPMGQAVSWAGAQWAFSWRLPDGPGCQLGGCSMGVQLAVARWARLSAGHAMAIPARCRGCQTRMICRRDLFLTQKNYDDGKWYCSNYIYSNI